MGAIEEDVHNASMSKRKKKTESKVDSLTAGDNNARITAMMTSIRISALERTAVKATNTKHDLPEASKEEMRNKKWQGMPAPLQ